MGFLGENHKCPRGPFHRLFDALVTVMVGGLVGIVLCYASQDRPADALLLASAALGAVLASAVRQAVAGGRP
ncbi:MAG: hypothetical protein LAO77_21020 [Acidobacteriia bacterium]|nr:hypothetical protein [Terriglobia bacterium]